MSHGSSVVMGVHHEENNFNGIGVFSIMGVYVPVALSMDRPARRLDNVKGLTTR